MFTKEQRFQQQKVADSWKQVLIDCGINTIKEISFNGNFFFINFSTKKDANDAILKCDYLQKFQYNKINDCFKYPHQIIGKP